MFSETLNKINNLLSGLPMTAVAGLCLFLSFVFSFKGIEMPIDPAWAAVVICGIPLLYLAVQRLIHNPGLGKISSALLISMAMIAAVFIGDLFAAGEVAFIMALGAILEDKIATRAGKGLEKLISLAPTQCRRLENGREELISAEEIGCGDLLRIRPGETIPVDGIIVSGETSVDQSIMTGESMPIDKSVGDAVFSGTVNRFGSVDIRATAVGRDSSLQKLIRLVEEAESKQAPIQRLADKAASLLVPLVSVITILTYLMTADIVRAVTVMVVFCPCALVLAAPTAIMAAIGQAASRGVVVKSGEALEKMGKVRTIAFDKTGTLTVGKPNVSDVFPAGVSAEELLTLAASAESRSEHPLGKAIAAYASSKSVPIPDPSSFSAVSGKGVTAIVSGKQIICGNEKYMHDYGIAIDGYISEKHRQLQAQGKVSVIVAADGVCIGLLALSDSLRPEAGHTVSSLNAMGIRTILLTGDNGKTAACLASEIGITEVFSDLLPGDKMSIIESIRMTGHPVCMIGDGINDAPALKTAAVGVAVGGMGSDIAIEAADIVLMGDDISKIPYLKRLADAASKTILFGIALSMVINIAAVALSVKGVLNPTTGALVHNAGSCFVILMAALLYDRKFD